MARSAIVSPRELSRIEAPVSLRLHTYEYAKVCRSVGVDNRVLGVVCESDRLLLTSSPI